MTNGNRRAAPDLTGNRLRGESLGRFDSTVMAVAGTAPAYSVAGTTATLVGAVGLAGPAALLYCGIPMLGIAFAFSYLTRGSPARSIRRSASSPAGPWSSPR